MDPIPDSLTPEARASAYTSPEGDIPDAPGEGGAQPPAMPPAAPPPAPPPPVEPPAEPPAPEPPPVPATPAPPLPATPPAAPVAPPAAVPPAAPPAPPAPVAAPPEVADASQFVAGRIQVDGDMLVADPFNPGTKEAPNRIKLADLYRDNPGALEGPVALLLPVLQPLMAYVREQQRTAAHESLLADLERPADQGGMGIADVRTIDKDPRFQTYFDAKPWVQQAVCSGDPEAIAIAIKSFRESVGAAPAAATPPAPDPAAAARAAAAAETRRQQELHGSTSRARSPGKPQAVPAPSRKEVWNDDKSDIPDA